MERELRIVLIGKTGCGKSATGNSILGGKKFVSKLCSTSVTSNCMLQWAERFERKVVLIDTPGLFDTTLTNEDTMHEVRKCIGISAPGPHAFILVKKVDRFTEEEQKTIELFKSQFGDKMLTYTLVLFTGKDQLVDDSDDEDGAEQDSSQTPEEKLITFVRQDLALSTFIKSCGNRYMAINNKAKSEREKDAGSLIDMIKKMVADNGGSFYSSEMMKLAEVQVAKMEAEKCRKIERQKEEQVRAANEKLDAEMNAKLKKATEEEKEKIRIKAEADKKAMEEKLREEARIEKEQARDDVRHDIQESEDSSDWCTIL